MTEPAMPNASESVDMVIEPHLRDLGDGFMVRRVLPYAKKRMVGPFVFFDHFGPTVLKPGHAMDVRPHPHIGLATVSYLFEGEVLHRDSLGNAQTIKPGAVNWMTAGRGIVHSERTPQELRQGDSPIYGIQSWIGLPKAREETAPSFEHYAADALPTVEGDGVTARVMVGEMFGRSSPVKTQSATFYADAQMKPGAKLNLPPSYTDRAIYPVEGAVTIDGQSHPAGQMLILHPKANVVMTANAPTRALLLGGEPLDGPRHIWWNLVSSSQERIEQAKRDWKEGRFPKVPGDEKEFIPLPA